MAPRSVFHSSVPVFKHSFRVVTGGKFRQDSDWRDLPCQLTMGELVQFQENIRAVAHRLRNPYGPELANYADVISQIWKELYSSSRAYDGLLYWPEKRELCNDAFLVAKNLARILPTQQNLEMVRRFYDLIEAREKSCETLHVVVSR